MVWILPESAVRQEELTQRLAMLLGCLDNGENHRATTIVGSISCQSRYPKSNILIQSHPILAMLRLWVFPKWGTAEIIAVCNFTERKH